MLTKFKLPDLTYPENALEPFVSRDTMATHHGKHHAAYIKKLNAALSERPDAPNSLEAVVRMAAKEKAVNPPLFNNAAQAWNHAFFWNCLAPNAKPIAEGMLRRAIERDFKSLDAFHEEFIAAGEKHFASGWVWLVSDDAGKVALKETHDADSVVVDVNLTPLVVCDVWEHAYYLDYKNDRATFLKVFIEKLANWPFAEKQYDAARSGGAGAWSFPV